LIERIKVHFRKEKDGDILKLGTILIDLETYGYRVKRKFFLTQREFEFTCYLVKKIKERSQQEPNNRRCLGYSL
jgi:DNA-binding response OmpR family regulator